jgi:hypothetical protein
MPRPIRLGLFATSSQENPDPMPSAELVYICVSAFIGVFLLLSVLAGLMRLIQTVFPPAVSSGPDAAAIAAITSVMQTLHPGIHVTKVEEIQ